MGKVTCLVADDHPAVVDAVCRALEVEQIEIVGRANDGDEALRQIESKQPMVALLDLRMPGASSMEIARLLTRKRSPTAIILYTAYGEQSLLMEAVDSGVRGFVLKEAPLDDLVRAIRMVSVGQTYVDPKLASALVTADATARLPQLTQREREVLRLLADGLRNEEIGRQLFISPLTVRTHIEKAMAKLDADTRTQAVATALRQALIK